MLLTYNRRAYLCACSAKVGEMGGVGEQGEPHKETQHWTFIEETEEVFPSHTWRTSLPSTAALLQADPEQADLLQIPAPVNIY